MILLFSSLLGLAAALGTQAGLEWVQRERARQRLAMPVAAAGWRRGAAGIFSSATLAAEKAAPQGLLQACHRALEQGHWEGWTVGGLLSLQVLSAAAFGVAGWWTGISVPGLFLAAGLGAVLPWLALREAAARRREEVRKALPDALDLLTSCVEAGLSFDLALQRVTDQLPQGPLRQELETFLSQTKMGRTRKEALQSLARRAGVDELRSLCSALIQAGEMGAPIGPVLRAQSRQLRALRGQRLQKAAAQAPVKLLFPLLVFILPVVFLVLFGPLYLKWSQGGF
jgi:tight adherence protein C